jgi:SpoVK/Ycf46/Vps4 family AAA+-type ATPase
VLTANLQGVDYDPALISALLRESVIHQAVLCLQNLNAWSETAAGAILTAALSLTSLVLATAEEGVQAPREVAKILAPVRLAVPSEADRRMLWIWEAADYPLAEAVDLNVLADKFSLTRGQIRYALDAAAREALWQGGTEVDEAALNRACYAQIEQGLSRGSRATRVPTVFAWEDLILPWASKDLLRTACDQVRYRHRVYQEWGFAARLPYGRGLSLLFVGPPGTGKTMGAQVVAGELGLELYKVDLAGVVSKYIGETEKNLREIFAEAQRSQAALFFDEADVLFSKRTEVKDAHDKYSNMEAAFMLQQMEEYAGVVILATNYLQNFDEAFKRRLKFVVDFPFPNAEYRKKLWDSVFPSRTPVDEDVDREYLAERFELSGSSIKNIAVGASFLAAARGAAVTMPDILTALRHELAKSGKMLSREDLGEYGNQFEIWNS